MSQYMTFYPAPVLHVLSLHKMHKRTNQDATLPEMLKHLDFLPSKMGYSLTLLYRLIWFLAQQNINLCPQGHKCMEQFTPEIDKKTSTSTPRDTFVSRSQLELHASVEAHRASVVSHQDCDRQGHEL